METSVPYQHLSKVYDLLQTGAFSAKMVDYAFDLLRRLKHQPTRVLDLCCGTGTAAVLMAQRGLEVHALDGSAEMLKIARRKFRDSGCMLKSYHQTLPKISLPQLKGKIDLVTCFYDSLNYVTVKHDLLETFKRVHRLMTPEGVFIFDMNTPWGLETYWTKTNAGHQEGMAWIWKADYIPAKKIADLLAITFVKSGKSWQRYDEHHVERGYDISELTTLLHRAEMKIALLYKCFTFNEPDEETGRIAIAAVKA